MATRANAAQAKANTSTGSSPLRETAPELRTPEAVQRKLEQVLDAGERGVLDRALGRLYREKILEPGRGRDELESLRAFLGREPNEEAFLKSLGLSKDKKRS